LIGSRVFLLCCPGLPCFCLYTTSPTSIVLRRMLTTTMSSCRCVKSTSRTSKSHEQYIKCNLPSVFLQVVHEHACTSLVGNSSQHRHRPLTHRRPVPEVHAFLLLEFTTLSFPGNGCATANAPTSPLSVYHLTLSRCHGQVPSRNHWRTVQTSKLTTEGDMGLKNWGPG